LVAANGIVSVKGADDRRATYGGLIGGKRFERTVSGHAPVKNPSEYMVVGKPVQRIELPAKMTGRHTYVHDVRVDRMLHGRVIRPASIGATVARIDDATLREIPGARVVRKGNFVGVVAEREEDAIRAARVLKVEGSES